VCDPCNYGNQVKSLLIITANQSTDSVIRYADEVYITICYTSHTLSYAHITRNRKEKKQCIIWANICIDSQNSCLPQNWFNFNIQINY